MNNVVALIAGLAIGLLASNYIQVARQTSATQSVQTLPALTDRWIMVPVSGASENEAVWKMNTFTGEARLCLANGVPRVGCVPANEAASLQELAH